jgi:hypothetical protein
MRPVFYTTLGSIESTPRNDISQLLLWSPGGRSQKVTIDVWDALHGPISKSSKIYYTGFRGEEYTHFCSLEIHREGDFLGYILELRTRPTMNGTIELQLQRGSPGSHWSYGSYSGNGLLRVLQDMYPEMCGPQTN